MANLVYHVIATYNSHVYVSNFILKIPLCVGFTDNFYMGDFLRFSRFLRKNKSNKAT